MIICEGCLGVSFLCEERFGQNENQEGNVCSALTLGLEEPSS